MLTPQEIQQKKFEKAVFGGYDMSAVDDFLDTVTEDYTALYKETVALKAKMKVLVDKIEEYRSVDEEMRKALLAAQNAAKEIVEKAKRDAETLTANACTDADRKVAALKLETAREESKLEKAREQAAAFLSQLESLHVKGLDDVRALAQQMGVPVEPEPQEDPSDTQEFPVSASDGAAEKPIDQQPVPEEKHTSHTSIDEIDRAIARASENALNGKLDEPEDTGRMKVQVFDLTLGDKKTQPEPEEDELEFTPKPKFKFDNLQFGKDYREED